MYYRAAKDCPMIALLLIDIQNDFLPGGALAVPGGDEVVAVAIRLMRQYELVVATQDWHPADHLSFASQHRGRQIGETILLDGAPQILWPDHCVEHTWGAELAPQLNRSRIEHVVPKGTDRRIDSYSGFFDSAHRQATGLESLLRSRGIDEVQLLGLATDYCVQATALDAVELGFRTVLLTEGVRGVDLQPGDCQRAIERMRAAGVHIAEGEPT
jgi:nicotinamidase/pyrazinamidase